MCDAGHRDNVVEILQRPATKSFTPNLLQGVEDSNLQIVYMV